MISTAGKRAPVDGSQAKVCAIILDYRGAAKTIRCLRSLAGQGIDQVIVVDNSADQQASQELRNAVEAIGREDLGFDLCVLTPSENLGFAKGVNFALQHDLRGNKPHDYYLLINNDAEATPDLVRRLRKALDEDMELCMVAPTIVSASGRRQGEGGYYRYLGLLADRRTRCSFPYLSGCCLMFRSNLPRSGKLFDEAFFMYGEDWELGWRMSREGKKAKCLQDTAVYHQGGASSTKAGLFYEYHLVHSHLLLALKTLRSPVEAPLIAMSKLLILGIRAIVRCVRYRSMVPLCAYFLAWFPLRIRTP